MPRWPGARGRQPCCGRVRSRSAGDSAERSPGRHSRRGRRGWRIGASRRGGSPGGRPRRHQETGRPRLGFPEVLGSRNLRPELLLLMPGLRPGQRLPGRRVVSGPCPGSSVQPQAPRRPRPSRAAEAQGRSAARRSRRVRTPVLRRRPDGPKATRRAITVPLRRRGHRHRRHRRPPCPLQSLGRDPRRGPRPSRLPSAS